MRPRGGSPPATHPFFRKANGGIGRGGEGGRLMTTMTAAYFLGAATILLIPFGMYFGCYGVLRLAGRLRVAPGGWYAEGLRVGGWVFCTALDLFFLYQRVLGAEAAVRRAFRREAGEPAVSDVAVEVVPLP